MKKKLPRNFPAPPCVIGEPDSELIAVCQDYERLAWFMTARDLGIPLEQWARDTLNEAAQKQLRRTEGDSR